MSAGEFDAPRESATVVLLREHQDNLEVLMLQKNAAINYGGSWVFPGGVVEEQDKQGVTLDREAQALATVLRETQEETGFQLEADSLRPFSNWLTPKLRIKRYNTLFFIAALPSEHAHTTVKIDGEEIVASRWIRPADALAAQASGEMVLNGPSYVTLSQLKRFSEAITAVASLTEQISWYEPRGLKTSTGIATVYQGDSAYEFADLNEQALIDAGEPHHRLYMHKSAAWEFLDSR